MTANLVPTASSADAVARRPPGLRPFVKGQSGNPRGRKAPAASLADYVQKQSTSGKELVDFLLAVLRNDIDTLGFERGISMMWRMEAAGMLLDRGFGKPVQPTEVTGEDGGPIEHTLSITAQAIDYRASVRGLAPSGPEDGPP